MILSYRKNIMITDIKIGENIIEETDFIKFLGIHIDNHLTFRYHINEISIKLSKSVGLLYKLNKFLPTNILKIIYSSLIHPYLIYGVEAWHGTFKNLTNKIFVLQKKAIRAVNSLDFNEHTNEYFISNEIMKLEDQYKYQISNYTFQLLNSNIDEEITSIIMNNQEAHSHDTRHGKMLKIPRVIRTMSKNNIIYIGPKVWNSLPNNVKDVNSLYKFKKKTKSFFIEQYKLQNQY